MYLRLLLRMSRWARNPPSGRQVVFFLGIIAACLAIAALAHFGLWPDWATLKPMRPTHLKLH